MTVRRVPLMDRSTSPPIQVGWWTQRVRLRPIGGFRLGGRNCRCDWQPRNLAMRLCKPIWHQGYWKIHLPGHAGRVVRLRRQLWEDVVLRGRLAARMVVHHERGVNDNRVAQLRAMTRRAHARLHAAARAER